MILSLRALLPALAVLLSACGGGGSGSSSPPKPVVQDAALEEIIEARGLTGDPATPRGQEQVRPSEDPLVALGQVVFFSKSLSGGLDVACASCHHPDFAGGDALSLSVGVTPKEPSVLGPGREVDHDRDRSSRADGGPNVGRNSPTTFNSALYDRALMRDGRIFVVDDEVLPGGVGQRIRTPETPNLFEQSPEMGLMDVLQKFPLVSDDEMRGFLFASSAEPTTYRDRLVRRLRREADQEYIQEEQGAGDWLSLFREAFGEPDASPEELITLENIQRSLTRYVQSQTFVDTPWKRYVQGDREALTEKQKEGAILFLRDIEEGGLGCAGCHAGDHFTNEEFYNAGFPQIGRGSNRADGKDTGRWHVTRRSEDRYAFRVPSLLNVTLNAPYGHAGTFPDLETLLYYHANPRGEVETFDFSLQKLAQFQNRGIFYEHAEPHTLDALAHESFQRTAEKLPGPLTSEEVSRLVAFLEALTDECAAQPDCRDAWTPSPEQDPDGLLLVRDEPGPIHEGPQPEEYPAYIDLEYPGLSERDSFAEVEQCEDSLDPLHLNLEEPLFLPRQGAGIPALPDFLDFGLSQPHGFSRDAWIGDLPPDAFIASLHNINPTMFAGGLTATYLDDDCWPDLVYTGGDASGVLLYRNRGGQLGFEVADELLPESPGTRFTGAAVVDLNGNYRRELLFGNLGAGEIPVLSQHQQGEFLRIGGLPMSRHTFGISFGDFDANGYPGLFAAHWGGIGVDGTAPVLWRNIDGKRLEPADEAWRTSHGYIDQTNTFVPSFADLTRNGLQDLVIASDFESSVVMENTGQHYFENVTDRDVITDENGMGGVLADFYNDGHLDWFVTSIHEPVEGSKGAWGKSGNRLYRGTGETGARLFEDVTAEAGVREGRWGWGTCAADFNNNGFQDIFMVSGYGYIPEGILGEEREGLMEFFEVRSDYFRGKRPQLFINRGDGTFEDRAVEWGLNVPSEGRGVVCFDYDRDGDIDIALVDHSTGIQFFESQIGHGTGHRFLNVRVVGTPPNTDALGARVYVEADVGNGHGFQRQMRVSQANNTFNAQNLPNLHFGLGAAEVIERLEVYWPDDAEPLVCQNVATNQFVVFHQSGASCP